MPKLNYEHIKFRCQNFINSDLFQGFKYNSILYLLVSSLYASPRQDPDVKCDRTRPSIALPIYRLVLSAHSTVLGVGCSAVYFLQGDLLEIQMISELVQVPRLSPLKIVTTVALTEDKWMKSDRVVIKKTRPKQLPKQVRLSHLRQKVSSKIV